MSAVQTIFSPAFQVSGKQHPRLGGRLEDVLILAVVILMLAGTAAQTQSSNPGRPSKPELVLQSAHTGVVTGVAFAPDGNTLASSSRGEDWSFTADRRYSGAFVSRFTIR